MSFPALISQSLTVLLVTVMLGIGLTITLADLKRVIVAPKAILVGLFSQIFVLPAVAFLICLVTPLPAEFKIGLILLAASPGGPSSNLYSLLANGDVALNLTLTAVNSVVNLVTMPLYIYLALWLFGSREQAWVSGAGKIGEVFFLIVIPTALGLFVNMRKPQIAQRLSYFLKVFSVLALVAVVVAVVYGNWKTLVEQSQVAGWVILLFNLLSLGIGYGIPRLTKLSRRQAIAISFEVGVHNGSLALFLAINVLANQAYAIPATLYSVLMYLTAGLLCFYFKRQPAQI